MGVEGDNRTWIYIYLFYTENPGLETNREVLVDRPTGTLNTSFMGNHPDPTKVGFTIPARIQESPLCVHPRFFLICCWCSLEASHVQLLLIGWEYRYH
jgi:hypothetical protein